MNNYWVGVITGCCVAVILYTCLMFGIIAQNNNLKTQVKELTEKVESHDEIMKAYEFYNWQYSKIIEKELKQ